MEVEITESGTTAFYLREGRYRVELAGTLAGSAKVALKAGSDTTGTNHVPVTDSDGVALEWTPSVTPEPQFLRGGGYMSAVCTDFGASADVRLLLRYASQE